MRWIVIYLLTVLKNCKLKAKYFEINAAPLCLSNVLKDFLVNNMKKTELYGYVYDISVDCDSIDVVDILDFHRYLMKQREIKQCLNLLKKGLFDY